MLKVMLIIGLLAAVASATPVVVNKSPITMPITRVYNFTSGRRVVDIDRDRIHLLKHPESKRVASDSVYPVQGTNAVVSYTVQANIGNPATPYTLLVDTGSANTWIGASKPYEPTSSSQDTDNFVSVSYGSGFFLGEEYLDQVTLGTLTIPRQSIGVAYFASGFQNVDGILGIGPVDLTEGTVSSGQSVPTVTDNAFKLGLLSAYSVGISFNPPSGPSDPNGELSFGGVDASKHTGTLKYTPLTTVAPASYYVGIDQSITYGSSRKAILRSTAGITDTGTTLIYIATDAFTIYQQTTGGRLDPITGLLQLTAAQYSSLQSLYFTIDGVEYEFTANAQIWPRALNTAIGGVPNAIYLIVGDVGSVSGSGLDFIDGYAFLERFYSVYDTGNKAFGLAPTPFTHATTN